MNENKLLDEILENIPKPYTSASDAKEGVEKIQVLLNDYLATLEKNNTNKG